MSPRLAARVKTPASYRAVQACKIPHLLSPSSPFTIIKRVLHATSKLMIIWLPIYRPLQVKACTDRPSDGNYHSFANYYYQRAQCESLCQDITPVINYSRYCSLEILGKFHNTIFFSVLINCVNFMFAPLSKVYHKHSLFYFALDSVTKLWKASYYEQIMQNLTIIDATIRCAWSTCNTVSIVL